MSKDSYEATPEGIDKPVICSAYEEPSEHWSRDRKTGRATREKGRRLAGYWYRTEDSKTGASQGDLIAEDRQPLPLVNKLRDDVRHWRKTGYDGASDVTKALLGHWTSNSRPQRLFFCQREAVETIIYLAEIRVPGKPHRAKGEKHALSASDLTKLLAGERSSLSQANSDYHQTLLDKPVDSGLPGLVRFGCKMATGSGKTLVMAMLIAWAFCNRFSTGSGKKSQFPSAVLVCCPNLTIRRRLSVLRPEEVNNYYSEFDLVPPKYLSYLRRGKVLVANWHVLKPQDSETGHPVIDKGEESPEVFARRVLGDLFEHLPIMVLNDEGHHCWRAKNNHQDKDLKLSKAEQKDLDEEITEAKEWIRGLDTINNQPGGSGVAFCVDMSATPFYIEGSGHPQGLPFPWIVSDFGLVDAIESGIVKIPRVPIRDTTRQPEPKYFRLWRHIHQQKVDENDEPKRNLSAAKIYERANDALKQIASQWMKRFKAMSAEKGDLHPTPPVLIIVCNKTTTAREFYRQISGEGKDTEGNLTYGEGDLFPEYFSNTAGRRHTVRIDSRTLEEAGKDAGEELRELVATVGKKGGLGEHVRCVISVSMLTEGWDASNVTQILGVRAFGRQLLCEQVVGRGLRKTSYVPDPKTGLLTADYVDVYGIPFSVVPYKGQARNVPHTDKLQYHVHALEERKHMEIHFPIVDGYLFHLTKNLIDCDVSKMSKLKIDPEEVPTASTVKAFKGEGISSPGDSYTAISQDRQEYYDSTHLNRIEFQLAHCIVEKLISFSLAEDSEEHGWGAMSRTQLFPQVHNVVKEYVKRKIDFQGVNPCELGVAHYSNIAYERLLEAIRPNQQEDETSLLPHFDLEKRIGTTSDVSFRTVQEHFLTTHSHINLVTIDSSWERKAADILEQAANEGLIEFYARIYEAMNFTIPCGTMGDDNYRYMPDFLVRMANPEGDAWTLVLEMKGFETEKDRSKHNAAQRWVAAVNNWGELGKWGFHVCYDPNKLAQELKKLHKAGPDTRPKQKT